MKRKKKKNPYKQTHKFGLASSGEIFEMNAKLPTHGEDVFKIQRPMGGPGPVLIYNKDHSVYAMTPMTPEIAKVMETDYKSYVKASISEDGILQVVEKLSWQPW